jgi:hypothetical protein
VRRALSIVVGIAAVATAAVTVVPVSAGASVASAPRGGFLVRPSHFHAATVQFRVPRLSCTSRSTTHVRAGLFGYTTNDRHSIRWFAAVTALCRHGRQHAYMVFGDSTPVDTKPVRADDEVRITTRGNSPWSTVVDLTSGTRLSGGPLAPPGQVTVPRVVIGARRTGSTAGHLHIAMRRAALNGKPIAASPHHRLVQTMSGHTVTRAGALNTAGGGFSLYIS